MPLGAPNVASVGLRVFPDMTGFRTKLVFGLQTPLLQTAKFGIAAFAGLGAALGSLGVLGSKAFYDIEQSMARVVGLVGIAESEVAKMTDQLSGVTRETARAPAELAEALFFITSAGIRDTADAMDILTLSAKAATAGLGQTKVVADAVTSAVNAYGAENLSAAKATDILVATVREGKVEADSVAQSLGRVIPVAAELGVSFDQVGATIASLTRLGLDASESTTSLRAILFALIRPARGAEKELAKVGLTTKQLRAQLRGGQSIIDLLLQLKAAFAGNEEAMARVFPRVRGLTGVLNLVGNNAEQAAGIFERMSDSTGDLDKAFQAVADTSGFQFQQAMAGIQATLLEIGQKTLPAFAGILEDVAPAMGTVTGWVVKATDAFADFIVGIGEIVKWVSGMPTEFRQAALAVGALGAALFLIKAHPIVAALTLVVGAIALIGKTARENTQQVADFKTELESMGELTNKTLLDMLSPEQIRLMREYNLTLNDMRKAIVTGRLPAAIASAATEINDYNEAVRKAGNNRTSLSDLVGTTDLGKLNELQQLGALILRFSGNYNEAVQLLQETAYSDAEQKSQAKRKEDMLRNLALANDLDVAMFGLSSSTNDYAGSNYNAATSLEELEARAIDAKAAVKDLIEEEQKAADPAFRLFKAIEDLADVEGKLNDPKTKDSEKPQLLIDALKAQAEYDAATSMFVLDQETSLGRLRELYDELGIELPEVWQGIIESILRVPTVNEAEWQAIGAGIRRGILSGLTGLQSEMEHKLHRQLMGALATTRGKMYIDSPSKLWAQKVGLPIAQGIAMGIEGGAGAISKAAGAAIAIPNVTGGGGGGTNITVVKPHDFGLAEATNEALEAAKTVDLSRKVLR